MTPPGFENAPEWAQTIFYGIMAIGAAYFALKKFASGARDEARLVRTTGRTSTVEEVIDGAPEGRPKAPPVPIEGFGIVGGSLINRQLAEDHLAVGRSLVDVLERLERIAERSLAMQEWRHERDEEEDRREEIRAEALALLKERGVPIGEDGVPLPATRPRQRPPRRG